MIIRDLEHYEIGSQINHIEQIEGRGFTFLAFAVDAIAVGDFVASQTDVNIINQQSSNGVPGVAGVSIVHQSYASDQPFTIG